MTTIDFERSVLSTVMYHAHSGQPLGNTELYEEWFSSHFHKIVVKTINAMRAKDIPPADDLVYHYLDKNGLVRDVKNQVAFNDIITANPFGSSDVFGQYLNILKSSKKRLALRV